MKLITKLLWALTLISTGLFVFFTQRMILHTGDWNTNYFEATFFFFILFPLGVVTILKTMEEKEQIK